MTLQQFRRVRNAQPFTAFVLYLADGRTLKVTHPEVAIESSGGRTVTVFHAGNRWEVIDLLLVVSIASERDDEQE